jgi:hypothetical protein
MVRALEAAGLITGIFFVVGIAVGFLIVMAIPAFGRVRASWRQPVPGSRPDPWDQLDLGPPGESAPSEEPDDRDDYPWWPGQR